MTERALSLDVEIYGLKCKLAETEGRLEESRRQVSQLAEESSAERREKNQWRYEASLRGNRVEKLEADVEALRHILEHLGYKVIEGDFRRADGTRTRLAVLPPREAGG